MLGPTWYRDTEMEVLSLNYIYRGKKGRNDHSHGGLIGKTLVMVEHSLVWEPRGRAAFWGESEGFTAELILEQDLRGWAGVWERGEGCMEHCRDRGKGLVCEAGRTVRGGRNADEGVARGELEKDGCKGHFGQPSLAFGPRLLCKHPGDFKAGSGVAEATTLFVFHFLPPPHMASDSRFSA